MSKKIGWAFTGSFCKFYDAIRELENLMEKGYQVIPIMSEYANVTDTSYGKSSDFKKRIMDITGEEITTTIVEAERFGPREPLDAIIVAPATGNTVAKLANGITDTSVTMAVKATSRNSKPVVLAIATNDALSDRNKSNIMMLYYSDDYYLVPLEQDDPVKKPNSLVARFDLIKKTLEEALIGTKNKESIPLHLRIKMLNGKNL